jgi:hypothetical protein
LADRGQYGAALTCAEKAVGIAPEHPDALKNLGCILYRMGRYHKARVWLEAANQRRPGDAEITFNLGAVCYALGELVASEDWYTQSAGAVAGTDEGRRARALTHLAYPVLAKASSPNQNSAADYRRGLALYEHRFAEIGRTQVWELGIPEWQGEDLTGKHILVHHDQGQGDTIQFARFLGALAQRAGRITLAAPRDLLPLFAWPRFRACPMLELVDLEGDLPADGPDRADYHSPVCSYLRHLDVELPSAKLTRYLTAEPVVLDKPPGTRLAIGLVWAPRSLPGSLGERSARRGVPLGELVGLAAIPGVALYSLQVGPHGSGPHGSDGAAHELAAGAGVLVHDLSRRLRDWADTASYMAALDLIVSVDSAPLHLAGAMGRPVIGLLPHLPCWRWGFATERTSWYPTMRLLRQAAHDDWSGPLHELHHLVRGRIADPDWELKQRLG